VSAQKIAELRDRNSFLQDPLVEDVLALAEKSLDALAALYEWYDRDGSVGRASEVFEKYRSVVSSTVQTSGGDQ
jgi:hypothetical protein